MAPDNPGFVLLAQLTTTNHLDKISNSNTLFKSHKLDANFTNIKDWFEDIITNSICDIDKQKQPKRADEKLQKKKKSAKEILLLQIH